MRPTIDASSAILPGQVGSASSYLTPAGTQAWQRSVFLDTVVQDDTTAAMVWLPGEPAFPVEGTPWVVYLHGATANEQQLLIDNNGLDAMLDSWLDHGWAVVSLRLGTTGVTGPTTDNNDGKWGNNACRDGAQFVDSWIRQFASLPTRGLLLYGMSAGGTNACNLILEWVYRRGVGSVPVAALAMVDPCLNLRYSYDRGGDGITGTAGVNGSNANIRSQIKAAYQVPNNVQSGTATWVGLVDDPRNGHDTAEMIDLADFPAVPVMMSASPGDTLIKKVFNTDLFAARLQADGRWSGPSGLELLLITTSGNHGIKGHFVPATHNAFFERALAR